MDINPLGEDKEKLGTMGTMGTNREKYWEEKSVEEKLDKLANAVEHLSRCNNELDAMLVLLKVHTHQANGEIVVPLRLKEGYAMTAGRYFLNRQPK